MTSRRWSALPFTAGSSAWQTEVVIGTEEGLPRTSSIRCDFLTLMFKSKLTGFVSTLVGPKLRELNRALLAALELPQPPPTERRASAPGPRRTKRR